MPTIDVRPPAVGEMPDYYRALPFANGLPSWEPADAAWHGGPEPWPAPRPPATDDQLIQPRGGFIHMVWRSYFPLWLRRANATVPTTPAAVATSGRT